MLPAGLKPVLNKGKLELESLKTNQNAKLMGLSGADLRNCMISATKGFTKNIFLVGVGYRFSMVEESLMVQVGRSNSYLFQIPSHLKIKINSPQTLNCWCSCLKTLTLFTSDICRVRSGLKDKYNDKGV
jgi:ribosomal protein L6P/L9E